MFKKVFGTLFIIFIVFSVSAQDFKTRWVDSVFQTLTTQQKIGQLFMISVSSRASSAEVTEWMNTIRTYQPGGVMVSQGGVKSHARLINQLQKASEVPLIAGINAEWGLGQTLDSAMQFQQPLIQGALQNDSLNVQLGKEIGRQMKVLGFQINFAPNADLDLALTSYPASLNFFSDNKQRVAAKSVAFMKGLQQEGVMACAKFTPDSYHDKSSEAELEPAQDYFELNRMDTLALYPLTKLISEGTKSILTSHLHFSMLGRKKRVQASVSELFIGEILRTKLNFNGLTFCEIPYLEKISQKKRAGEVEKLAFTIGNDVMIAPGNIKKAIRKISALVKKDAKLRDQLSVSVKKILAVKYETGLASQRLINTDNLLTRLNSAEALALKLRLAENAVTVLRNASSVVPIKTLDNKTFASISIGKETNNEFNQYLSKYTLLKKVSLRSASDTTNLKKSVGDADIIIVSIFPFSTPLVETLAPEIIKLAAKQEVIVCSFGNPKDLTLFEGIPTIIASYSENDHLPKVTAEVIFGGLEAKGVMPYTAAPAIREGQFVTTTLMNRLSFTVPEAVGMDSKTLYGIREIIREGIETEAFPGCQVIVARKGKIVFDQSFGWYTYENKIPVTDSTIYDLASLTKVSATLQAVMFLKDKGIIDTDKKASVYLPDLASSNKKDLTIKDILTHQSGLLPFIPIWNQTVAEGKLMPLYYSYTKSENYPLQVAPTIFASPVIRDSVWRWTVNSKLLEKPARTPYSFRYSDIGLMIMHKVVERSINQPMEDFLAQNLYEPLGAGTLGYLPLTRFPVSQIAPTENDTIFRKQWIVGTVHDERAALLGGVAGHAGLFGSAIDLAKLGQMLLNGGSYGGIQFYKPETVSLFTTRQYEDSRRGLGWAKAGDPLSSSSFYNSPKAFGHTGFTGTCIWVDPEFDLVFVFLSNRVYPDRGHNKISSASIRPRLQEVIYKSIFNYCQNNN